MNISPENLALITDILKAKEVTSGLTGAQHTAIMVSVLCENLFTEASDEDKKKAFVLLLPLSNASALRQYLESKKVLTKTEGKRGASAEDLAAKWMS